MSEQTQQEVIQQESTTPVLSIEDKAKSMGWRPLEEYKGDPDAWVEAKEFVSRSSFFKKIDSLKEKISQQEQILKTVHNQLSISEQRAYQKALDDVKAQMSEARLAGDFDAYEQAAQKQQQLQTQPNLLNNQVQQQSVDIRNTDAWKETVIKHPWINENTLDAQIKKASALVIIQNYERENPGSSVEDICKNFDIKIREKFPDLNKSSPTSLGVSKSGTGGESSDESLHGLSPAEIQAVQYYKDLKMDTKSLVAQFRKGKK